MKVLARAGIALLLATAPGVLVAQEIPVVWGTATGTSVSAMSVLTNGTARMNGTIVGGDGGLRWNRISLRAGYSQGVVGVTASPPSGAPPAQNGLLGSIIDGLLDPPVPGATSLDIDHVQGFLNAGWSVLPALEVGTGARARAHVSGGESDRTLMWTVQGRYEAPLGGETFRGFAEAWTALMGTAPGSSDFGYGRGGAAGILANFGRLATRMSYGVDVAKHGSGADLRRETVEGFTLAIGFTTR